MAGVGRCQWFLDVPDRLITVPRLQFEVLKDLLGIREGQFDAKEVVTSKEAVGAVAGSIRAWHFYEGQPSASEFSPESSLATSVKVRGHCRRSLET